MKKRRLTEFCVFCAVLLVNLMVDAPQVEAAKRQGDRFGLRFGAWPQDEVAGELGKFTFTDSDSVRTAVVGAPSSSGLIVEGFILFSIHENLWFEGSLAWMRRRNVSVLGVLDRSINDKAPDIDLLGFGRVDFIPAFVGARYSKTVGQSTKPHNVYGRAGISLVFASESPEIVYDRVRELNLYSEGSEGSLGLLVGAGGDYAITPKVAFVLDLSYRFNKFKYSRNGAFDISGPVVMIGLCFRTR